MNNVVNENLNNTRLNGDAANDFELISALVDGALLPSQVQALLARVGEDTDLLAAWHGYQFIGEALRAPAGDAANAPAGQHKAAKTADGAVFLADFHARLALDSSDGGDSFATEAAPMQGGGAAPAEFAAQEVLAVIDTRREAANASVFRWKLVSGFASVAAVAAIGWSVLTAGLGGQSGAGGSEFAKLAQSQPQIPSQPPSVAPPVAAQAGDAGGVMLRDPRLDAFMAAHKQFGGASALAQPAGFLRSASYDTGR